MVIIKLIAAERFAARITELAIVKRIIIQALFEVDLDCHQMDSATDKVVGFRLAAVMLLRKG